MSQEVDDVLHDYLDLKDEVERQRRLIEDLTRPRHWTQDGPRGAQATAIHHALDHVLERAVKLRNRIRPAPAESPFERSVRTDANGDEPAIDGFYTRMRQATDLLGSVESAVGPALNSFVAAVEASEREPAQVSWLGLVAALGRYPRYNELERATRTFREGGADALGELLETVHLDALETGETGDRPLGVRSSAVIIDVTHTARSQLHTGIQRVVRETVSRWLSNSASVLVWWDDAGRCLRELGHVETYRFRDWCNHLPQVDDDESDVRNFDDTPRPIVVPWDSVFVLPELAANHHDRSTCYRALVASGVVHRFGAIGFDLVPLAAAETVNDGMTSAFGSYLSVVKLATRLSAISESSANEFRALNQALTAQGLKGPVVAPHPLPPTFVDVSDSAIAAVRGLLADDELPVVLVVGSREPRKNQIAILEASQHLWLAGHQFNLVLVGGSGWQSTDINDEIDRLQALGRSITVRTRASEVELFAWYRIARFSVFPSLYEGFGLPIAESLGLGTPVVTSDYGAMREVAASGGALMVDPRDPEQLRSAMQQLLTDDELLAKLRDDAQRRVWPTWDAYAKDVWNHLVESNEASADRP